MTDIMKVLEEKFRSGNEVPVTRSVITLDEYEQLVQLVAGLQKDVELSSRYCICP